jgi:subtilisin family serine protease
MDYALDRGAKVIALALQGPRRLNPAFEAALARATAAGAVVVVAAGNDAQPEPSWPARYAADPRFAGSVVAVGAVNARGQMTRWSNRAGDTRATYLLAPGQNVVTDCDTRFCTLVSGTSFAVPYVAGAIALVMQARPDLNGREAADLVLRAARDLGRSGPDAAFGRGLLDVGRAVRLARQAEADAL